IALSACRERMSLIFRGGGTTVVPDSRDRPQECTSPRSSRNRWPPSTAKLLISLWPASAQYAGMSRTASGSVVSNHRREPAGIAARRLRAFSTGKGQFRPLRSRMAAVSFADKGKAASAAEHAEQALLHLRHRSEEHTSELQSREKL